MRKYWLIFVITLILLVPIQVAHGNGYLGDVAAVSWLDRDAVIVVLANESSSSSVVTVSTNIWDSRWRPIFTERTITVPARSLVQEVFYLNEPLSNEPLTIRLSQRNRATTLNVQTSDLFKPTAYVVQANENISVEVDLSRFLTERENLRLMVDEYYRVNGSNTKGAVEIKKLEGGLRSGARNSIEFVQPLLELSMRAPQLNGVAILTFNMKKGQTDYGWGRGEDIQGPSILVYGRNLRFSESKEDPLLPRIITR